MDFSDALKQLDDDWRIGNPKPVEDYLGFAGECENWDAIAPLVLCDLRWQWDSLPKNRYDSPQTGNSISRHGNVKKRLFIEEYLDGFDLTPTAETLKKLVLEEYKIRQTCGDEPRRDEYHARFQEHYFDMAPHMEQLLFEMSCMVIGIQSGGANVFSTLFDKQLVFGRQAKIEPAPYCRVASDAYDRILIGRSDERHMSRASIRFDLASRRLVDVSNTSSFQILEINSTFDLAPAKTKPFHPPFTVSLMNRTITVEEKP